MMFTRCPLCMHLLYHIISSTIHILLVIIIYYHSMSKIIALLTAFSTSDPYGYELLLSNGFLHRHGDYSKIFEMLFVFSISNTSYQSILYLKYIQRVFRKITCALQNIFFSFFFFLFNIYI